ncbi:hypothetical protein M0R19_05245 [Candidatus Pacearchaeota archaeon]|jgi:hypothetical protein|nr:hypothetical protein [Candidatus Pacearchaeota archaeon]
MKDINYILDLIDFIQSAPACKDSQFDFARSIYKWIEDGKEPTERQIGVLEDIKRDLEDNPFGDY